MFNNQYLYVNVAYLLQCKCTAVVLQVCNPVRNTSPSTEILLTAQLSLRHLGVLIRSAAELQLGAYDIYSGLDADSTHGFACKCRIVNLSGRQE